MGAEQGWVVLTDDYPPAMGGVATWTWWAVRALASRGPVHLYCRARAGLAAVRGVSIHPVRVCSFARFGPFALAWEARHRLRRARGVLCTTWPVARVVSRWVPVQVVAHGSDLVRPHDPHLLARVWRRCARTWAVSEHLVRVARSRSLVAERLPVPVPPAEQGPLGTRWVFVGRAIHGKGGDRFVRWVAEAGVEGDLVGDGPALAVWRALARRLGASVRFHGALPRSRVEEVYRRAAAVFLPARRTASEGLGLCLLEARARGIPVVGTDAGGVAEALGPEGLLVDPSIDGATIRDAIGERRPRYVDHRAAFLEAIGA